MDRSILRFAGAVTLISSVFLHHTASAGTFEVGLLSKTQTTVVVRVRGVFTTMCYGNYCFERSVTTRISPCPPGKTCAGDTYVQSGLGFDIALTPGVTYTFEGDCTVRSSTQNVNPCSYNCVQHEAMGPVQYQAPPSSSVGVSVVSADENGVWIDVALNNESTEQSSCMDLTCRTIEHGFQLTPCPLAVQGSPGYPCSSGTMYILSGPTVRVLVSAGLTYTITGGAHVYGFCPNATGPCGNQCCAYSEDAGSATFHYAPVATERTSWGKVKTLYRSP